MSESPKGNLEMSSKFPTQIWLMALPGLKKSWERTSRTAETLLPILIFIFILFYFILLSLNPSCVSLVQGRVYVEVKTGRLTINE